MGLVLVGAIVFFLGVLTGTSITRDTYNHILNNDKDEDGI